MSTPAHREQGAGSIAVHVIVVSSTRTEATDVSGKRIAIAPKDVKERYRAS